MSAATAASGSGEQLYRIEIRVLEVHKCRSINVISRQTIVE